MTRSKKFFVGVLVVVVVVIAAVTDMRIRRAGSFFIAGVNSASNGYQAVFLTNSQVYFGKLSKRDSQFSVLKDIYYLQVNDAGGSPVAAENIALVKLGSELHGPLDQMMINRDHILLIEDLRDDSNVVDAIKRFKAEQE